MNELLAKISSYNIFNYLLPGATLVIGASRLGAITFKEEDLATRLLIFYVVGLIVSRISSLVLQPALRWSKLVKHSEYRDYVAAAKTDDKIPTFLEVNNTYRALAVSFVILAGVSMSIHAHNVSDEYQWKISVALLVISGIMCLSVRKQSYFINRRVEYAREADNGGR